MHDFPALFNAILTDYVLPLYGHHGVVHWARVLENGLRIAETTGADTEVVELFAIFHDARRVNEYIDDDHGLRGGELAHALRGSLVLLDNTRFELLYEACRLHTNGLIDGDPTLRTCWDADRLELGRVGIEPLPHRLCTDAARALVPWAHARAGGDAVPYRVLTRWGVPAPPL